MPTVSLCIRTRIYREGLARMLQAQPGLSVEATCACIDDLLVRCTTSSLGVLIADPRSEQNTHASLDAVHRIISEVHADALIVLGCDDSDDEVVALLAAGASAYVSTSQSTDELLATVQAVTKGELLCSPRIARRLQERLAATSSRPDRSDRGDSLSHREMQILDLVKLGLSNKEIARQLRLEVSTIKNHMHNVLAKLGVRSRLDAVASACDRALPRSAR